MSYSGHSDNVKAGAALAALAGVGYGLWWLFVQAVTLLHCIFESF